MKNFTLLTLFIFSILSSFKSYSQETPDLLYNKALKYKYVKPQLSISYLNKSYNASMKEKDTLNAIKSLMTLSTVYSHNVNYGKAYDGFWTALLLAEKIKNRLYKGRIHQELGWLYSFYNRDKEALKHFNLSLHTNKTLYQEKIVPIDYLSSDYFAFTNFYRIRGNKEMYKKYLDSCIQTKKLHPTFSENYYLDAELAHQLANEKKYDEALSKFKEVKAHFEEKDPSYLVIVNYLIGDVYKKMELYQKSEKAFLESLQDSENYHSHTNYKIMSCDALVELYNIQNKCDKAFEYLQKSKTLNDSVFGSKSKSNQHLFNLKDTYRITKERQEQQQKEHRLKQLEQEDYIWFLKYVILITSIIFILIFGYLFIRNLRNKHKNEKKLIFERQQLELKRQNQILELKNKELTTSALQLIEKEEFLANLKDKLSKQTTDNIDIRVINRMVKSIQGNPTNNWKEFEARFTQINQSFYQNLNNKFPSLGQTDLKICALIKLNFSSKEMSSLLGISIESVHTSRYRLRKKLGLERNESLTEFINSI